MVKVASVVGHTAREMRALQAHDRAELLRTATAAQLM